MDIKNRMKERKKTVFTNLPSWFIQKMRTPEKGRPSRWKPLDRLLSKEPLAVRTRRVSIFPTSWKWICKRIIFSKTLTVLALQGCCMVFELQKAQTWIAMEKIKYGRSYKKFEIKELEKGLTLKTVDDIKLASKKIKLAELNLKPQMKLTW